MIRGGYKIIDLKNKELTTDVGMVFEGIYDAIEETTKPILISGLNLEGHEYPDYWALPNVNESNYIFMLYLANGESLKIVIDSTDVVKAEIL